MKRFFVLLLLSLLMLPRSLGTIGNSTASIKGETEWIYQDPGGVHATTNYYKAETNSTGEILFKDLSGETELASGFQYVIRENVSYRKPVVNPSFENVLEGLPQNWVVTHSGTPNNVQSSIAEARSGSRSLRVEMIGADSWTFIRSEPIYAKSPQFFKLTSIWIKANVTVPIYFGIRLECYYDATKYDSCMYAWPSTLSSSPTTWTEVFSEKTFLPSARYLFYRIGIFVTSYANKVDIYLDDASLRLYSFDEMYNASILTTNYSVNGNSATIWNTFQLKGVSITRTYYLWKDSPRVKTQFDILYPTAQFCAELMRLSVSSKTGWIVVPDKLNFTNMASDGYGGGRKIPKYGAFFVDDTTPHIVLWSNNVSIVYDNNMQGYWFDPSSTKSVVDFVIDEILTHIYYNRKMSSSIDRMDFTRSYKKHTNGETASFYASIYVGHRFDKNKLPIMLRQPYGFHSTWIVTDHADGDEPQRLKALMLGSGLFTEVHKGKGFLGLGIPITKSVFPKEDAATYGCTLDDPEFLDLVRSIYSNGIEIVPHSLYETTTNVTIDRTNNLERLSVLEEFDPKTWIDHGAIYVNLHMYGWDQSKTDYYILDMLEERGYKYSWSFQDYCPEIMNLMWQNSDHFQTVIPYLIQRHPQAPQIYEFTCMHGAGPFNMFARLTEATDPTKLSCLIDTFGVAIFHTYICRSTYDPYHVKASGISGIYNISETLQSNLEQLSDKVYNKRLLWTTTVGDWMDFITKQINVKIQPDTSEPNTYVITTDNEIAGLTFFFDGPTIQSALVDQEYYVAGINASTLWLPKLTVGSHTLKINFGSISVSVPHIKQANVCEIYGYTFRDMMKITLNALSGTKSTTKVYCGDKGGPKEVYATNGTLTWSYNASTMILTLNVVHNGPANILVDWRIPGDVNGDGKVDYSDLFILSKAYGSKLEDPKWNLECDFNGDNKVEASDLFDLSKNYGKTKTES